MSARGLTQHILDDLGGRIVAGGVGDGRSLPTEAQLCEEYEASRSVMREAVKMLAAKGLLTSRPKVGLQIRPQAEWNLLDPDVLRWLLERDLSIDLLVQFTQMRMAIEPFAVRLAAAQANAGAKERLRAAMRAMERAEEGGGDPLQTDIDLHIALLYASENQFMIQHASVVDTALRFSIRLSNRKKNVRIASVEAHRRIVDAVIDGDGEGAAKASMALLEEALAFIEASRKPAKRKRAKTG